MNSARRYAPVVETTIRMAAAAHHHQRLIDAEDERRARDADELRDECGDVRDEHRAERDPRPGEAVVVADQLRVTFARHRSEAHRHLLHDEERHDQQELQDDQLHAVLRARGCGRRHAARFRVGESDDQSGTHDGHEPQQPQAPDRKRRGSLSFRVAAAMLLSTWNLGGARATFSHA